MDADSGTGWRERAGARWQRLVRYLRGAPATVVYTFTVLVTWYSVGTGADQHLERALLRSESTNVANMAADPLRVLVASAFWIDSPVFPILTTGGLLLVMVPAERVLGTRRWIAVFALGHVVASVVTVVGIALAVRQGMLPQRITGATDVGVSYGSAAVLAVAVHLLPHRLLPYRSARRAAPWVLAAVLAALAVFDHTATDVGHLVAFAVGTAAWPGVRWCCAGGRRPSQAARRWVSKKRRMRPQASSADGP